MRSTTALLFCCARLLAVGQEQRAVPRPTNTFFLEGLGQAIYWSANFEHTEYASARWALHIRAGLGVFSTRTVPSYLGVPLTLSGSYGSTHRAEFGAGFLFYSFGHTGRDVQRVTGSLFPTFHAGYRYQKELGGLFLRGGIMFAEVGDAPGFDAEPGQWGFNPYVCVGTTF